MEVICDNSMGADKDSVLKRCAVEDRRPILNFSVVTDGDTEVDIGALADRAVVSQPGVFPHLSLVPDPGAFTYVCVR